MKLLKVVIPPSIYQFSFEESIRVPLIIQYPRIPQDMIAKTNNDLTLNINLGPTVTSILVISVPNSMQGIVDRIRVK